MKYSYKQQFILLFWHKSSSKIKNSWIWVVKIQYSDWTNRHCPFMFNLSSIFLLLLNTYTFFVELVILCRNVKEVIGW